MKRTLSMIAFATLTVGLLGSCSKINERLDNLEKEVSGIENEQIASINSQIDGIKTSIADLGTIRSDISSLKQSASDHSVDIFNLEEADRALKDRIVNLEDYVDAVLPNYAEKEWVEATFSTLEQYEATCDTIAKIDARIGAVDAKLSKDIKATADSLTKWVNKQFEGYYTAAQMDVKLAQMKSAIDSSKASGKISDAKADSIATELTNAKAAVDTAKANIRAEYRAAIDTAIKASEGKLTKALTDAISEVNGKIELLAIRVGSLETKVNDLIGRVEKLEGMIQSVTIVPAYSDGSLEDVEGGILTIDCIISPASAATSLTKDYFKVLVNTVKTKAVALDTAKVSDIKIGENGIVSIFAQAPAKPSTGSTHTAALRIKDGANADYTTEFHTFDYSGKNVKVVDLEENGTEYNKVYIVPSDPSDTKTVGGPIPAKIEDGKKTFDEEKTTVIEVRGIGTVTFDKTATAKIAENANGADQVYFTVKDVTSDAQKQAKEIVYQVTMTKVSEQGEEVFSESKAAGEVTMEIPLGSDVADVTKVTLLNEEGKPIDGGVVYGSVIYDNQNNIVTFKVKCFSKSVDISYVPSSEYIPVTGISLDKSALELEKFNKLIATITPTDASNKNVIWSSSDTTKVTVDKDGKVTAVAEGKATITATSMNNRSLTATCEVTVVPLKLYVEIAAKYDGSTVSTLRWYRQSLAITDSGKKAWKGDSGSAVKIPGTDEDVVVGDYFQWGTFAGFYGSGADKDMGLLPYTAFTNEGCGDASDAFTFNSGRQFNQANAPYWSGSAYTKYNATDKKTTLEASDDVASIILGDTWRMPTADEFKAMKEATYWAWDATDIGYYVYTPNPASDAGKVDGGTGTYDKLEALLFFPTAGNGYTNNLHDTKSIADYWYGSLNSTSEEKACHLFFNSSGGFNEDSRDSERFRGFSVRPVQDPAATYVAVTNVSLDVTAKEIEKGGNVQLKVTVAPATATQNGVYWTSSAPTVATVDATGKVTAVAAGTATITATTVDGTKTATCTVTVTAEIKTIADVLATAGDNAPSAANHWNDTKGNYIYVDGGNLLVHISAFGGDAPVNLDNTVTPNGDNYLYSEGVLSFTFNMTEGVLTSIYVDASAYGVNDTFSPAPNSALKGVFSVSADKKVRFSKGNLVATIDASGAPTAWKFAANQYEYIGENVANTKIGQKAGDVDLFGWSTTSTTYGINTSKDYKDYLGDFYDWGKAVGDGNTWRTLSKDEWVYLINKDGVENIRKGKYKKGVTVCGKTNCLILAPDDFTETIAASYDAAAWATAEAAGLVCLPAAGYRNGSDVKKDGTAGNYWSSSAKSGSNNVYNVYNESSFYPDSDSGRSMGFSVRLVTEVSAAGDSGNGTEQYNNNSNPDWFSN